MRPAGGETPSPQVCIIDILQTSTLAKRLERLIKMVFCCRFGGAALGISVVEPHYYAKRFLRMLERILDAPGPASANSKPERAAEK